MSPALSTMPDSDPAYFLKIAGLGVGLSTHADLWRWLQGDVQPWLAHEVMLVAWGDFRSGELRYDVVSSLAGMRSHHWNTASLAPLISYLRDCWVAAQQLPCQIDITAVCVALVPPNGVGWASLEAISSLRTALVHGMRGIDGGERLFVALSREPSRAAGDGAALKVLLPFIDSALMRMPPAPLAEPRQRADGVPSDEPRPTVLSGRERQIMAWVAMGKTNPEIGCILCISEFTVKNHMKSIFSKLDVTNRAQAVARLTRSGSYA
jgi:transcriptional regulator EpsA